MTCESPEPCSPAPVEITHVTDDAGLTAAAMLFREYADSLQGDGQTSLTHQNFDAELLALPGRYAEPTGCILLATVDNKPVGCVALREIAPMPWDDGSICEMKRMYVKPSHRGLHIGRLLGERLITEAAAKGYSMMKLDTEPDFAAALGLYRSLGLVEIPRYNDDPVPTTMYLGLQLSHRTITQQ